MTKVYDRNGRRIIAALWDEISQKPDRINEIAVLTDPNKLQYVGWNDVANELQLLDFDAVDIPYDNSGSGLVATNVQDAIDELAAASGVGTVFSGFVSLAGTTGTSDLPTGWTVSRPGAGRYVVVHSLSLATDTDLHITATCDILAFPFARIANVFDSALTVNSFEIRTLQDDNGGGGGALSTPFFFVARQGPN